MTVQDWLGRDNQIGIDIWEGKYKYKDEDFEQWLDRVSNLDNDLKKLIKEKKFLMGGRALTNRGLKNEKGSYFNCYSYGYCPDDFKEIMKANTVLGLTYKAQGGQGISLSKLRPKGTKIGNRYESDGIIPFMQLFNTTTAITSQAGSRKGALMISLDIRHKQAEEFITIKTESNVIDKANLSLEIDDEFMNAVKLYYTEGKEVIIHEKREYSGHLVEYDVNPVKLYKKMIECAYDWGEPGCIFTNKFRNYNLMEFVEEYQIETCNPCGEQPLPKNFCCNLGSINLSEFVENEYSDSAQFNFEEFRKAIHTAIKTLDILVDENEDRHPVKEQSENSVNYRNIGLGVMGMSTMLFKMGIKYGSKDSIEFLDKLFNFMFRESVIYDVELAKQKGSFPMYSEKVWDSNIIKNHFSENEINEMKKYGIRNCSLLSIAPTGSLATMLGVTGGCEPEFAISYTRKTDNLKDEYKVYCNEAKYYMKKFSKESLPDYFVCSADINWKDRVSVQGIIQKHIDTAISSTVNLPFECTKEEIEQLYLFAWESGLKGITLFRDGCKRLGILTVHKDKKDEEVDKKIENKQEHQNKLERGYILQVNDNVIGKKRKLVSGCGSLHCEAFFDPVTGELLETYLSKGSTGGCVDADTEYFNGKEWKKISDYKRCSGEKVLQYTESGFAELVEPLNYIVNDDVKTLKRFTNNIGLDMVLSEDHRMYLYKNYRKYSMGIREKLNSEIVTVSEYLNRDGEKERHVPTTFKFKANGITVKDEFIRLLVAVYADGTYDGHKIIMSLKKNRKKERIRQILNSCDIGWSERDINGTDYTQFCFYPIPSIKEWFIDKKFTEKWYDCDDRQLSIIVDECVNWDGSVENDGRLGAYYSSKKEEVDFIQFALSRLGYRASISNNNSSSSKNNSYRVRWTKQNVQNLKFAKIEDYETVDGHSYCFTVPSGLLVLRRNGHIFVTGNCNNFMIGLSRMISLAARGGIDIYSIVDQLNSCGSCPSYAVRSATKHDTSRGSCCPMAVGNALLSMYKEVREEIMDDDDDEEDKNVSINNVEVKKNSSKQMNNKIISKEKYPKCPICGERLYFEGGCNICKSCGWSKCD